MLWREFHAKSLDKSLAERHQRLGWRGAGFLDGGDAPAADSDDQRVDPTDGTVLDRGMGAADIEREEQDEAALGCNLAHACGDTAAESISHTTWLRCSPSR
jgi:hypothetical protein